MDDALSQPLAPLREDLRLFAGAPHPDGSPAWIIEDPVRNRHFRIGWLEFECLARWHLLPGAMLQDIRDQTTLEPDADQVLGFAGFLQQNDLLRPHPSRSQAMATAAPGRQWLTATWWLHHYLFFRIPLLRPTYWLGRVYPYLRWVFRPATAWAVVLLSLLGLFLTLRQWDTFRHTLFESVSWEGALGFACALAVAKTLHEFGHALVATHMGVRVGHMGVAFLVMWPMLYTDTSESWRLADSRKRLMIASAGIITELAIAGLATLCWALLPPGVPRQACFYLATTSWVLSLALNASPFMRFDGYFILSDLLDMPNLHERAGALTRIALRRRLWGWNDPWPEPLAAPLRRKLIIFACVTWLYRLIVYFGIALAVYHLFFKALGLFLFAVEIVYFIAKPIWREVKMWWQRRRDVPRQRRGLLILLLAALLAWLATPWPTSVRAPALARSAKVWTAYAPTPGQLLERHPPGEVRAGSKLILLDRPELGSEARAAQANVAGQSARLTGLLGQQTGIDQQAATIEALAQSRATARSVAAEQEKLLLVAPFDGRWLDAPPDVQPGAWVSSKQVLGRLVDPKNWLVDAYVGEADVQLLSVGGTGCFYLEHAPTRLCGSIRSIAPSRSQQITAPLLTTVHGGPIPTVQKQGALVADDALYLVTLAIDEAPPNLIEQRGKAHFEGAPRSRLLQWMRSLASLVIRESGW
ncbi:HlyD family efflux transporter periplasmic adaptor subunit [Achromobacter kerstersii]|uniref:HlyD family efflux transporter periplasmic adaptor subunit n=1 Tax=Achromobacter kerstersii TaxID=1353890 RepID=UPI003D03205E